MTLLKTWAGRHPRLFAWGALAVGMVIILLWSAKDVGLLPTQLAALVVADAVIRLIPGVLGDGESLLTDSFQENLLGAPQYTKPAVFRSMNVPEVLLSGNHKEIERWRRSQQHERTQKRRKDLLS